MNRCEAVMCDGSNHLGMALWISQAALSLAQP